MIYCVRCGGHAETYTACQGNHRATVYVCSDCGAHMTEARVIPAGKLTCEHTNEPYKQMCRKCGYWLPDCGCATGEKIYEKDGAFTLADARENPLNGW